MRLEQLIDHLWCRSMAYTSGSQSPAPRVAVIGVGQWGQNIVRDLCSLGVRVTAIDPNPRARDAARQLGAVESEPAWTPNASFDGVIVATPASTHAHVVHEVASAEIPVACEKPLTVSSESALRLIEAVGDRLTVLHVWRYHPGVVLLGELARSGRLGSINAVKTVRTNWTSPRNDIDPVWTLLPHDLSIAIEIFGSIPRPAAAVVEKIDGQAAGIWATFGGGNEPPLIVEASTRYSDKRREIRVHGTEGIAVLAGNDATHIEVARGSRLRPEIELLEFDSTPPLQLELESFVSHVRGGPRPKTDGREGLAVVEAVEHALALAEAHRGSNP